MEHTKGKWEVGRSLCKTGATPIRVKYSTGNVGTIAWICCRDVDESRTDEETQANARLIAAAPALLEACEGFVFLEKTNMTKKQVQLRIDIAKQAIAQATQKTS